MRTARKANAIAPRQGKLKAKKPKLSDRRQNGIAPANV